MTVLIKMRGITKIYESIGFVTHVLNGISLDIEKGEYVSIIGPSGAGKSTLMSIMGCLGRPTAGSYILDGEEVDRLDDKPLSQVRNEKIGFVFQAFHLLPGVSAFDNVLLPLLYCQKVPADAEDRVKAVLDKIGLGQRMHHTPGQLSGGEQQRVTLARALINRPELLLADEPTGNLDSRTGADIMGIFDRLNSEGNTIVLITHDPRVAAHARRTIRLKDGLIEEDSDHENIEEFEAGSTRSPAP